MKLALGTAQFGLDYGVANRVGKPSRADLIAILGAAREAGIHVLDTATAYGDSERNLGESGLASFDVISKVPLVPTDVVPFDWLLSSVKGSLQRLSKNSLEGLLLHRPLQLLEPRGEAIYEALLSLKGSGLVDKIGISVYSPDELDLLCSRYALDIVQIPFNIMDRRLLTSGWLDRLSATGTEVHVRSVLLQGLLAMSSEERPSYFDEWGALWSSYDQWLLDNELGRQEACVRYALSFNEIKKVVVGVDTLAQLQQILSFTRLPTLSVPDAISSADEHLLNPGLWKI